jgi:hypothetical protein
LAFLFIFVDYVPTLRRKVDLCLLLLVEQIGLYLSLATMTQKIQIPMLDMYVSRTIHM